jgi:hypothetical protein
MTKTQWLVFDSFRTRFQKQCETWQANSAWLGPLEKEAADADGNPEYPLETSIVYNRALDSITESDEIKLIVVGDNPGKDEQLEKNRRYLVGQSGKLADGFFRKNPELGIDFRKNVIILNKTPIHTAKTKQLAYICKKDGKRFNNFLNETQEWMARETAQLQKALECDLWLVGYGELRAKGLFAVYADVLGKQYLDAEDFYRTSNAVRLYQHFSMNRFSIDLDQNYFKNLSLADNLRAIGYAHRNEILGW